MHPNDIPHPTEFLIISGLVRCPSDAEQVATVHVNVLYALPPLKEAPDIKVVRVEGA